MKICRKDNTHTFEGIRCLECHKANIKKWHEVNKDKIKASKKAWKELNSEREKANMKAWKEANPNYMKAWREANPEQVKTYKKAWKEANKEREKVNKKAYYEENKEQHKENMKAYAKANRDKCNAIAAKRRSKKLNATPKWLTEQQLAEIEAFYTKAKELEKETNIKHHVDHIVPLQGKLVSGLHVPWNLQILTATENISKGNKLTP